MIWQILVAVLGPFTRFWSFLFEASKNQLTQKIVTLGTGGVLAILGQKVLWPILQSLGRMLKEWIYRRIGGTRVFNWWPIGRYRAEVIRKTGRLSNPWLPENVRQLEDFFVPVRVSPTDLRGFTPKHRSYEGVADIRDVVVDLQRFVLIGEPGAGKSTTLQSLALALAQNKLKLKPNPLPVLIELKHFARSSNLNLEDYIIAFLKDGYGFPKPKEFLKRQLQTGLIMVLLDALDEVGNQQYYAITNAILEFGSRYRNIGLIITCRAAAYNGQLDSVVDATVAMADFNQAQIRRFISAWEYPSGKSDIDLTRILRDRPTILAMCRNPLMLTIIVSLYVRGYKLPQARADFFSICARAFLEEWDQFRGGILRTNRFDSLHKERILQVLALHKQLDTFQPTDFSTQEIRTVVSTTLPSLGISANEADGVLREIILNNALIIRSGAEQLRFSHLAFQEYFAAKEIAQSKDASYLLARIDKDTNRWREVALLFCGISPDSTVLVDGMATRKNWQLAGLMIADARGVEPTTAEQIVHQLQDAVVKRGDPASLTTLVRIATQQGRTWSEMALSTLRDIYAKGDENLRWTILEEVLLTGTSFGASMVENTLAIRGSRERFTELVRRIGDPCLPTLEILLASDTADDNVRSSCLSSCAEIASPEAALLIIPFIENADLRLRLLAALVIAKLLKEVEVETSLYFITQQRKYEDRISSHDRKLAEWVWPANLKADGSGIPSIVALVVSTVIEAYKSDPELFGEAAFKPLLCALDVRILIPITIELASRKTDYRTLETLFPQLINIDRLPLDRGVDSLRKSWSNLLRDWARSEEVGVSHSAIGVIIFFCIMLASFVYYPKYPTRLFTISPHTQGTLWGLFGVYVVAIGLHYFPFITPQEVQVSSKQRVLEMLYSSKFRPIQDTEMNIFYDALRHEVHAKPAKRVLDPWLRLLTDTFNFTVRPFATVLSPMRFIQSVRLVIRAVANSGSLINYEEYLRACMELMHLYRNQTIMNLNRYVRPFAGFINYIGICLLPLTCYMVIMISPSILLAATTASMALYLLGMLFYSIGNERKIAIKQRNVWVAYLRKSRDDSELSFIKRWLEMIAATS